MQRRDYHLVGTDGQPFFWLADTAWNIWCRGTPDEWDHYLSVRKRQGFNVIQFVPGWWRGSTRPVHGRPFDLVDGELVFDENAWESIDLLFTKIRDAGLVAAPIMLWTLTDIDPGQVYSEEQCVAIARKQLERWDGPDVVWMLGGDGIYTSPEAEARWKRIGRAVFGDRHDTMATLHPCGVSWVCDAFAVEPWYRIATIQSGHGSRNDHLRFLVDSDYARAWKRLTMPFLNLEPNYEDIHSFDVKKCFTAYHVRRASYWSLLVAPPAGVTYGINSIWIWAHTANEAAENHGDSCVGQPWRGKLETPGAESMVVLKRFFEGLPWTRLRPAPELLTAQPGADDPEEWQAVAATPERDCVVVYAPRGGRVALDVSVLPERMTAKHVDPLTGRERDLGRAGPLLEVDAGAECDALLVLATDG